MALTAAQSVVHTLHPGITSTVGPNTTLDHHPNKRLGGSHALISDTKFFFGCSTCCLMLCWWISCISSLKTNKKVTEHIFDLGNAMPRPLDWWQSYACIAPSLAMELPVKERNFFIASVCSGYVNSGACGVVGLDHLGLDLGCLARSIALITHVYTWLVCILMFRWLKFCSHVAGIQTREYIDWRCSRVSQTIADLHDTKCGSPHKHDV